MGLVDWQGVSSLDLLLWRNEEANLVGEQRENVERSSAFRNGNFMDLIDLEYDQVWGDASSALRSRRSLGDL